MSSERPASGPGPVRRRQPRGRWLIAAVVALLAGGLVAARSWNRPGPVTPAADALHGTAVVIDSGGISAAPARWEAGVPVGWPPTEAGAISAAAEYATVLSARWFLTNTDRRNQAVAAVAAPDARHGLQAAQDQVAAGIVRGPLGAGLARRGVRSVLRTSLLGYRVDRYTPAAAEVALWAVVIYGNDGGLVPQALYATSTLRLVWAGDWKLTGAVTVPGPVPVHGQATPSAVQEVIQADEDFKIERSKSIELIVYLALHPQGVTPDELWEALWPDRPVNRGTLHTTVTAARTGLGRAPDGTRYLPDAHDGHYRLSPQVGLDWARFHALIAKGEDDSPEGLGLEALRSALELVRGIPLTSPTGRGYEWAVVHRTEMETVIAEVAERLALRYLEQGDHRQANWAARRGLLASPYDERLYRVLMRAADAAGNPAGVEAVWKELLSVLDADLDLVDDELHPETIALYAALRPRGRPKPAAPRGATSSTPQS